MLNVKISGLVFLLLVAGFLAPMPASAEIYYVSPSGSDANPGTAAEPFETVQFGIDTLSPSDTLYLKTGVYYEKVDVTRSGGPEAYITIAAAPGEHPVLDGANSPGENVLEIYNKSYIRIIGLEIRNNAGTGFMKGISVDGSGRFIEIRDNSVHHIICENQSNNGAHGIAFYGPDGASSLNHIIVDGNAIYDCQLGWSESLVFNGNVEKITVTGNVIHDNNNIGIDFIGFEQTAPYNDRARHAVCSGNLVYNITSRNNPAYGGDACADGIYVDGGQDITIERNQVINCDIGIEAASEWEGKAAEDILIRNNLVRDCGLFGVSFGGASAGNGTAEQIEIYNNTLYNNAVHINVQNADSASNIVQNNIAWQGVPVQGNSGKSNVISSNFFEDPGFVDVSANDWHLQATSPAIDAGVVVNYGDVDLDGRTRVVDVVDMGCYEYSPGPPTLTGVWNLLLF